jgi:hypothetical protein
LLIVGLGQGGKWEGSIKIKNGGSGVQLLNKATGTIEVAFFLASTP